MNQTDQITDWTGLRLDVQAIEVLTARIVIALPASGRQCITHASQ
jgi:hypothetical protein